ncbi:MFS general substrate transporter [Aureobasidium sp. EXF-12298]|nr:MFS general substrate transporter [Aureobasidium sp. EXF-12298]KAI4753703.1 MFS general substrate transporter [Aureobasidium sp. EXF-12344]KAI4770544.1 MFS general substrate transporter [Aureobasidium sp. EXF-3400]
MQTLLQYRREQRYASLVQARTNSLKRTLDLQPPSPLDDEKQNSDSDLDLTGREHSSATLVDIEQQRGPPLTLRDSHGALIKPNHDKTEAKIPVKCDDDGKDQADPHNWSRTKRTWTTVLLFCLVFSQGWVSACDSNVTKPSAKEFHVSQTSETLATALFLLGISLGSLIVGPLSEELGRNPVYLVPSFLYLCFLLGDALSPNFGAQIAFRFLSGLASSSTLSIYGGSLADLYTTEERNKVWPVFALSPLLSPILSPVAGGWIDGHISWRWVYWIGLIMSGAFFLVALFFLPETSSPMILQWRAHHLRVVTGSDRYTCELEGKESLGQRLAHNLQRPAKFFTTEPIIMALGFYLIVIYIVIFDFLNGFEFVFTDTWGLSPGDTALAFLGICIGSVISVALMPLIYMVHRKVSKKGEDGENSPEALLLPAMVASPFFAISIFWLAWTSYRSVSYWSAYVSTVLFGYSMTALFVSSYSYIINIYGTYSSSALGSVTMARYFVAAGMVVAARPMYQVLERNTAALGSGQNIDIRGVGKHVIEKLGLTQEIKRATTGEEGVKFVDANNRIWAQFAADKTGKVETGTSDVEILRGRLAEVLLKQVKAVSKDAEARGGKKIEFIFDDSIEGLEQDGEKVHVRLAKADRRTYDLVVGADGLQSKTRKLAWGAEQEGCLKPLRMYGAFFSTTKEEADGDWRSWYHAPGGVSVMLRPSGTKEKSTVLVLLADKNGNSGRDGRK